MEILQTYFFPGMDYGPYYRKELDFLCIPCGIGQPITSNGPTCAVLHSNDVTKKDECVHGEGDMALQ